MNLERNFCPPPEPQWKNFPGISKEEFNVIRDIWLEEYEEYKVKLKLNNDKKDALWVKHNDAR